MNKICLTARSRVRKFPADKYDEFVRVLETLDETTLRQTINQPSDVLLDDRGRLQCNGFTLTPLAMSQLCTHVARGLHSLATDIAGENRSARGYDHAVSVPVAARIINECIKLRFSAPDGLLGRDMIQNHRDREVEGIVGPRYRYLPSSQLLTGATDMLESHDVPMTFSGGELRGRRMCVTYLSQDTLGRTPSGGHLLGGAYFTNSEAGECGVRGALMLSLGTTSLRCLAPFNRISHVGRTFTKRLGRMLGSVLSRWEGLSSAAAAANTRLAVPLELLDDNDRLKKSRRSKIIRQLRDRKSVV